MNGKKALSRLLMAFVLVSIGVAIGKESERSRAAARASGAGPAGTAYSPGSTTQPTTAKGQQKVVVYYLHATFHCATCNAIEAMTDELIRTEFADALGSGRLEWKRVDYLQDEQLASHYNVGGNMVVVARFQGGKEVQAKRLDKVMDLANDRTKFMDYVRPAIAESLKEGA